MTYATQITHARPGFATPRLFRDEPLFAAAGAFLLLAMVPTIAALVVESRQFLGENLWIKPLKFQASLAVYLLTLAYFARYLPSGFTAKRTYRVYAVVVVFCTMGETAWISGAAMYGAGSHFNVATPIMSAIYTTMGIFAVTLTSATLVYGIAILRQRPADPFVLSIGIGLVLTFALTLPVAGYLSSMSGHLVGTPGPEDLGVMVMGWSREVGDLRVAHFFATHGMHFIPVIGAIAGALLPERTARPWILLASAAFVGVVAITFWQAINGQPVFHL